MLFLLAFSIKPLFKRLIGKFVYIYMVIFDKKQVVIWRLCVAY